MECAKLKLETQSSEEESLVRPVARKANGLKILRKISTSDDSEKIRNYNEHYDSHTDWGNA
jgi:hypothetical protein